MSLFLQRVPLRPLVVGLLSLLELGGLLSHAVAQTAPVSFVSKEHTRGDELYPKLEVQFFDGGSAHIPREFVFDLHIDEVERNDRLVSGPRLNVNNNDTSRKVSLLVFDAGAWLLSLGKPANQIRSASVLVFGVPVSRAEYKPEHAGLISLYAPPAGSTWGASTLAGHALAWNEAGPKGLIPASSKTDPYPPEAFLQDQGAAEETRTLEYIQGDYQQSMLSGQTRFYGKKLTDHLLSELAAGRKARFILYARDPIAKAPGLDDGAWPSSAGGDSRASRLARSMLVSRAGGVSALKLTGKTKIPDLGGCVGSGIILPVVGADDSLTFGYRTCNPVKFYVTRYDKSLNQLARREISACDDCPNPVTPGDFRLVDLHLLADRSLVVVYTFRSQATGGQDRVRIARFQLFSGFFNLLRQTALPDRPRPPGQSQNLPFIRSSVSPKGNVFVVWRDFHGIFDGGAPARMFEVNPITGQIAEFAVPHEMLQAPLFDLLGNRFHVWASSDGEEPPVQRVNMSSISPAGAQRFRFKSVADARFNFGVPICAEGEPCIPAAVSDEDENPGRLYTLVDTPSGRVLYTVEPTEQGFALHNLSIGASNEHPALKHLDGRGRVVLQPGGPSASPFTPPIFVSRAGTDFEDSKEWPIVPKIAMLDGSIVEAGSNSQGPTPTLVDADGRPLLASPPRLGLNALLPSRNGLYAYAATAQDTLYHWEIAPGAELSVRDEGPLEDRFNKLDDPLAVCTMPNDYPRLRASFSFERTQFQPCMQDDFFEGIANSQEVSSGFPFLICEDGLCDQPEEQRKTWIYCPSGAGTNWVVGTNGCFDFDPKGEDRWRTVRKFVTEATPGPGQLRLTPRTQEISVSQTATISASNGSGPVFVRFTLGGDVDRLSTPLERETEGTSVTLDPRRTALTGAVTITAESLDHKVARALVYIKRRPSLIASNPDPNPGPADPPAQQGATLYRYFRIIEGPATGDLLNLKFPDLTAVFKVRETNRTITARGLDSAPLSHLPALRKASETARGLIVVKIPWTEMTGAVSTVPATLHLDLQHFLKLGSAAPIPPEEPFSIELKIGQRPYEKTLEFSTATEGTLGALQGTLEGSGTVGFEDKDFLVAGADAQLIEWQKKLTAGLSFATSTFQIGNFKLDGPELKGAVFGGLGESFKFEPRTADPNVQHFEILQAVEAARTGGALITADALNPLRTLFSVVSVAVNQVINPTAIAMRREATTLMLGIKAAFELNLQIGVFADRRGDDEASLYLELSGFAAEHSAALTRATKTNAHEITSQIETDGKIELFGSSLAGVSVCPNENCEGKGYVESVTVDTTGSTLRPLKSISFTQMATDANDVPFEKTWTLEGADAAAALSGNCAGNLGALAYLSRCTNCAPCADGLGTILNLGKVAIVPQVLLRRLEGSFRDVPALRKVTWDQTAIQQQETELTIGGQVFGLGLKLNATRDVKQESRGVRGVLIKPRGKDAIEYPLESYTVPDLYIPDLGAIEAELGYIAKLGAAVQALSSAVLLAEFELFGNQVGNIRHPSGRRGDSSIPPLALDITYNQNVQVDVTAWPKTEPDPNLPVQRDDVPPAQPFGQQPATLLVGAFHDFHQNPPPPEGTAQIVSAVLSIGYPTDELGGIAEQRLQMGRWYPGDVFVPQGRWDLLGGTVNDANDTVTISSNVTEGIYGVLFSTNLTCPTVQPLTVSAGQVGITWTAAPEADVNGYSLYRAPRGSETYERIATLSDAETSYTDLVPGETRMLSYAVAAQFGPGSEGCLGAARSTDGDGDQISDLYEISVGLSPTQSNLGTDMDSDGITDGEEVRIRTNPALADTDGDGLDDGDELNEHGTEPVIPDTDGDGASDGAEVTAGTNPRIPDSDADGLLDGEEVSYHTNPTKVDTDEDGISDGDEVRLLGTDPARVDTDRDGLKDLTEIEVGTDPLLADTDGDGAKDGREVQVGTDPLDPNSFPSVLVVRTMDIIGAILLSIALLGFGAGLVASRLRGRAEGRST